MDREQVVKNLNNRGFKTYFCEEKEGVYPIIDSYIKGGESIGFGGSMTMKDLNMQDYLIKKGCTIYGFGYYDGNDMYQKAHVSDWYFSSVNAITEGGDLVNIDGRSNRIGAIVSGPKNVILIASTKKIVGNLHEAVDRIRNVVAPLNAERLNRNTPCRHTGKCSRCYNSDTMCNNTLIMHHPSTGANVILILVDENLGY